MCTLPHDVMNLMVIYNCFRSLAHSSAIQSSGGVGCTALLIPQARARADKKKRAETLVDVAANGTLFWGTHTLSKLSPANGDRRHEGPLSINRALVGLDAITRLERRDQSVDACGGPAPEIQKAPTLAIAHMVPPWPRRT